MNATADTGGGGGGYGAGQHYRQSAAANGGSGIVIVRYPIPSYTITATAGVGGTISPSGVTTVAYATDNDYTIAANPHYYVVDVFVDGVSQGAISTYTFSSVKADHTIAVTFAAETFTIETSASANGTITPSSPAVDYGTNQTFLIQPDAGYHVVDVIADGVSQGAVGSYTFYNVTSAGHTISATFAIDEHTISASAGPGGAIAPSGDTTLTSGESLTCTITPDVGYHTVDVLVDGVSQGPIPTYTFSNVTANHTISATFAIDENTISASAGPGGSIAPSGDTTVALGGSLTCTITPDVGYHTVDVLVDGVSQGPIAHVHVHERHREPHHLGDVRDRHVPITTSPSANGTITPSSPDGRLRLQPDVPHPTGRGLPHRGCQLLTECPRGPRLVHLLQRHLGRPHDLGDVRDRWARSRSSASRRPPAPGRVRGAVVDSVRWTGSDLVR